jgi:hypothetical protein
MGYSLHVPLAFGRLKFKSESRLRQREKDCRVTVWRFGSLYVVWEARRKMPSPTAKIQLEARPSRLSAVSRRPAAIISATRQRAQSRSASMHARPLSLISAASP